MELFEITIAESFERKPGKPYVPGNLGYLLPDEALARLEPVLQPYGQDPQWYFDKLNFGRPPRPWALACLDAEYAIAGHVASARTPRAGISFAPYTQVPQPMPEDFIPRVGTLVFASKNGLDSCKTASPLFAAAWEALADCPSSSSFLVLLDRPDKGWLDEVTVNDRASWLQLKR